MGGLRWPAILLAAWMAQAGAAEIARADGPLRMVRGDAVYRIGAGGALQRDDMLETGSAGAELAMSPAQLMLLGPATRVYLARVDGAVELVLLRGWIKIQVKARGGQSAPVLVTALPLRLAIGDGVAVVHGADGAAAAFSEQGVALVHAIDTRGGPGAGLKLGPEQFALGVAGRAATVLARPTRDFIATMPVALRDPVPAAPARAPGGRPAPVRERALGAGDIAPWLDAAPGLRRRLLARYGALFPAPARPATAKRPPPSANGLF